MTEQCSNCYYSRTDTFTSQTGALVAASSSSLACHFWPMEPPLGTDSPVSTWRKCSAAGWCGQWADKNLPNPQYGKVTVNSGGTNQINAVAPVVNVTAAQGATGATGTAGAIGATGAAGPGFDTACDTYRDRITTTNANPTVIRSIPMAINSTYWIDALIQFWDTPTHLTGGYIWDTLSYGRGSSGAPVPYGTLDLLESHNLAGPSVAFVVNVITNAIDITVTGKAATSVGWSCRTLVDKG